MIIIYWIIVIVLKMIYKLKKAKKNLRVLSPAKCASCLISAVYSRSWTAKI